MSTKRKELIKHLKVALSAENNDVAEKIVREIMQEIAIQMSMLFNPLVVAEVPFVIAMAEVYAETLRTNFPDECEVADELKKIPFVAVQMPANGGNDK